MIQLAFYKTAGSWEKMSSRSVNFSLIDVLSVWKMYVFKNGEIPVFGKNLRLHLVAFVVLYIKSFFILYFCPSGMDFRW
jgi:hypothetical protein